MSAQQTGPDWGWLTPIIGALTVAGSALAAVAKIRADRGSGTRDEHKMTLDGVFKLVDELQEEMVRKDKLIAERDVLITELRAKLWEFQQGRMKPAKD